MVWIKPNKLDISVISEKLEHNRNSEEIIYEYEEAINLTGKCYNYSFFFLIFKNLNLRTMVP